MRSITGATAHSPWGLVLLASLAGGCAADVDVREQCRIAKQDQDRQIGAEPAAHRFFDSGNSGFEITSPEQLQ